MAPIALGIAFFFPPKLSFFFTFKNTRPRVYRQRSPVVGRGRLTVGRPKDRDRCLRGLTGHTPSKNGGGVVCRRQAVCWRVTWGGVSWTRTRVHVLFMTEPEKRRTLRLSLSLRRKRKRLDKTGWSNVNVIKTFLRAKKRSRAHTPARMVNKGVVARSRPTASPFSRVRFRQSPVAPISPC